MLERGDSQRWHQTQARHSGATTIDTDANLVYGWKPEGVYALRNYPNCKALSDSSLSAKGNVIPSKPIAEYSW
jgi:hypothetical protein